MKKVGDNRRIEEIIEIVIRVARGDLDCQAQLTEKNDNLDSLAMGINMMIDDLKSNSLIRAQNEKIKAINEELIIAKEKAEESDKLKSAFLANISHEIRTPLNGILGFAELLRDDNVSDLDRRMFVNIIENNGQKLLSMINELIDISRIESGVLKIEKSEISVREQLVQIFEFFSPVAKKKGLKLKLNELMIEDGITVFSDLDKIHAILVNLVNNSIKYTQDGLVEIGYKHKTPLHEFYVKDTGIGIKGDKLETIFDRFVQVNSPETRTLEGAGLGLAISKSYVEMLGGSIWAESVFGEGSTFYFTIPD